MDVFGVWIVAQRPGDEIDNRQFRLAVPGWDVDDQAFALAAIHAHKRIAHGQVVRRVLPGSRCPSPRQWVSCHRR